MDVEIVKEREMPLLNRKRVSLDANYAGSKTPSSDEVKKVLAKKLGVSEELVAIRHIYQRFGSGKAKIIAHIYDKVEDLKALEKKKVKGEAAPKVESPKGAQGGKEKDKK